jgi:isoamylase
MLPGRPYPLGASVSDDGVNFSIFSDRAERVELLLFDTEDTQRPHSVLELDPRRNRSYYYWHCFVPGLQHGQVYAYRVHGPFAPEEGSRMRSDKVLLDPYTRAVVATTYDREAAKRPGDNCAQALKSVVVDTRRYDWEGDRPLNLPFRKSIIYELHVGSFTRHPSSGVAPERRGTFAGLIEKIPYLQQLGITAVELMPVQHFDPYDAPPGRINYWGYSPVAFFAPYSGYAVGKHPAAAVDEFRDLVKAMHRAGIEVILDVVFNHTAEGGVEGPTLSFKGLGNETYYLLDLDRSRYRDFTGTGNTVNGNHSIVRRMIRECLRYWVREMHVDGFRFDLAASLARGEAGHAIENPPILWELESDPELVQTKLIAEAWDIELYQLGTFPGDRWAEWNGHFRDDVRRFLRGDHGMVLPFANRLIGSPDVFRNPARQASRSINFVTCHDGFTLNDLVSYEKKHNEANAEDNRDGSNANFSRNYGVEGPTDDPRIEALRYRQIKNFLTVTLLAHGTPMLLMGDEMRRTQHGNNNAYCQDNEISWLDWSLAERHAGLVEFTRQLIALHRGVDFFNRDRLLGSPDNKDIHLTWHGEKIHAPDFSDEARTLACCLVNTRRQEALYVAINTLDEPRDFELPPAADPGARWCLILTTATETVQQPGYAPPYTEPAYRVDGRTIAVFQSYKKEPLPEKKHP